MTGWRIGWIETPAALGQTVENLIQYSTSGTAVFVQRAGIAALEHGEAVAIFPEGTISRGEELRARRGVSRLVRACPGVPVILAAVEGGNMVKKFPRRPRVIVEFFLPRGGQPRPDESLQELADRLIAEIRGKVPPAGG
jgi:1-acyl-sn-glycerol-3-phosphate acyltransferase